LLLYTKNGTAILASFSKVQSVFYSEKLSAAEDYLLIISLLIYELVLLIKTQNIDNRNSINNLSKIEQKKNKKKQMYY
jgi:hypothetical protein